MAEFTAEFNRVTAHYVEGFPLGCRLQKGGGRFTLQVLPPGWGVLLRGGRSVADVWAACHVRWGRPPTPSEVRTLLGTARSLLELLSESRL